MFLYSQSLDLSVAPEIWVMLTAWYGMIPTGNQAGEAIHMLVEENKAQHPWHCPPQLQQDTLMTSTLGLTQLKNVKLKLMTCKRYWLKGVFD